LLTHHQQKKNKIILFSFLFFSFFSFISFFSFFSFLSFLSFFLFFSFFSFSSFFFLLSFLLRLILTLSMCSTGSGVGASALHCDYHKKIHASLDGANILRLHCTDCGKYVRHKGAFLRDLANRDLYDKTFGQTN